MTCTVRLGPGSAVWLLPMLAALAIPFELAGCVPAARMSPQYAVRWDSSLLFSNVPSPKEASERTRLELQFEASWDDSLELIGADRKINVTSCRQLLAFGSSYQPAAFETSLHADRLALCRAVRLALGARPATVSFWNGFTLDAEAPRHLSAALALVISSDDRERVSLALLRQQSWGDVENVRLVAQISPSVTRYRADDTLQELTLLGRGDFNQDGIEDLLLLSRAHLMEGSYASTRLFLVSRTRADQTVASTLPID